MFHSKKQLSSSNLLRAQAVRVLAPSGVDRALHHYSATLPPMSSAMATGLTMMLLSVTGSFGLLLSFIGVSTGANLVAIGVRMADHPVPTFQWAFGGTRDLQAFVCRNTAAVGLIMASCAVTVVSRETEPVLCFITFALLLVGVFLIHKGARGE